jgi:type III pantothenate kinase
MPAGARVLELDVGNTRLKWRWLGDDEGRLAAGALQRTEGMPTWTLRAGSPVPAVRVVSVAGADYDAELAAALGDAGFSPPRFARAAACKGSLRSGYLEPERLGADRWVALVAAAATVPGPCAVVDAGSAITFDQICPAGRHEGGWIVPGLGLMRRSLLRDTAGVRFERGDSEEQQAPGVTTAQAVAAGTLHMARDFVRNRWAALRVRAPVATLFVTGGDGALLAGGLPGDVRHVPELVLDGLRICVD